MKLSFSLLLIYLRKELLISIYEYLELVENKRRNILLPIKTLVECGEPCKFFQLIVT